MDLHLTDKVAFVAGGSRGIGLAIAAAFLVEGARVAVTARDAAGLDQARAALGDPGPDRLLTIVGDMTDEGDIARALDQTRDRLGTPQAVVANVGSGTARPGYALNRADWDAVINTNLMGGVLLASQALPRLVAAGGGSLTFIASIAGLEAIQAPVPYAAAKAALIMAMGSYARQTGPAGVRVNAVAPGNILFPGGTWERKLREDHDRFMGYVAQEVPLGRFGTPQEIADLVIFLASARASFITGAVMVADGGQTRSFG